MARYTGLAANLVCFTFLGAWTVPGVALGQDPGAPGSNLYAKSCAACHDKAAVRMPSRSVLQQRTGAFILKTLRTRFLVV